MQTGGYNAFSFNHVAERVGIKKPSIMHHFPTKAALGSAVVQRYRETFGDALNAIGDDPDKTALDAFNFYCTPYIDFGATNDKVCLCGALAGEFMALPEGMKEEVAQFFKGHIHWLETILKRGKKRGEFNYTEKPSVFAKLIVNSLQGALIAKRATGDDKQVYQIIAALKSQLIGAA